jgi:2-methylisocitrate lyase-like PEP mutase family enzyme
MGIPGVSFGVPELTEAGARRISVGSALARLAYGSFVDATREMMSTGTFQLVGKAMDFAELEGFF